MKTFKKALNPIYTRIDEINDFSQIKPLTNTEKDEYPYLEIVTDINAKVAHKMISKLNTLEVDLENQVKIIAMETDLDSKKAAVSIYNQILKEIEECIERINQELKKLDSPYFGKIVFELDLEGKKNIFPVYIGKFALIDPKTFKPLISDWRAPIANIYYNNSGPATNLFYDTPSGIKNGNLLQKRQFDVSEAKFKHIYDAKSGNIAADEFLLAQLTGRLGQKLQDIVATIQTQQNEIIREEIGKPVIIQGVAGSGKTTILLHRLAYLFYTYNDTIKPEKALIIGPNQVFLDYIADVLPSLGIEQVIANTYLFWAKNILGWNNSYVLHPSQDNLKIKEYKGSLEFINILDTYFEEFESELLNNIPYSQSNLIRQRYYELKEMQPNIAMGERLELSLEYAFFQKQFKEKKIDNFLDRGDIKTEKKKEVLNYFKKNTLPIEIYRNMFKKGYVNKEVSKYTLENVSRKGKQSTYKMEDLAPILYFHLKVHDYKEHEKEYVMIDEAQDLSLVQILTLLQISKQQNVTIAGDLAQSIIPPFYIKDWKQVIKLFDKWNIQNYSYHQLNRCYRTTFEIIEYANKIFRDRFPKTYKLPEAVLRHGEQIRNIKHEKSIRLIEESKVKELIEIIKKEFEKGSVTVALICRDKEHVKQTYDRVIKYEQYLERDIVDYTLNDFKVGLLILTVEDAKGLEFDTVILMDVNNTTYPDTELSTRLLYVAITRSLHRLIIIENSNRSPLLNI